jgi:adenylate cyclase
VTPRLWLVRHGETDWSAAGRLSGWRDVPLSGRGRAQARALADRLDGQSFVGTWSSDLGRSIETARLAIGEPSVDRRLRELNFGALEGRTWGELDEAMRSELIGFDGFQAPGGESVAAFRARVLDFIAALEAGDHLVFTHGGVIRLLLRDRGSDRQVEPGEIVVVSGARGDGPIIHGMSSRPTPPPSGSSEMNEEFWRRFLEESGGDTWESIGRKVFKHIPADPRCTMCASPFKGPGAPLMRLIGKWPSKQNPKWCHACFDFLSKHHGGAEVEGAYMFADIRGSTALAERMSSSEYHALLDRYFATATTAVFKYDGLVDKFVGDELVTLFFPLLAGERYVSRAVQAAQELLRVTGHGDPAGPWVPVGVGVHAGRAWFGVVGEGTHTELTAVGDNVNVAARLASLAQAGEALISVVAAAASDLDPSLERRTLDLKGKSLGTEVVSVRIGPG